MMINQKENTMNALGTALIIVLFLFLFSSFTDRPIIQSNTHSKLGSSTEVQSNNRNAVIADAVKLPSIHKSCLSFTNNLSYDHYKTFADSRRIIQSFILLQKIQLLIKPITSYRFYYHLFSYNADDWPVLS